MSDRVLILGGTGMLGHEAVSRFTPHFEVHASVRDPERAAQYELPATLHAFDAYEPQALAELLDVVDPAVVLNCIGIVKQLEDASRPLPAIALNSLFPHQLAAMCEHKGCRLIHVSTDCVFSGRLPLGQSYREEDEADARDLYGLTKLLGEVKEPFLTVRTSIIGWELERASGLLAWFAGTGGQGGLRLPQGDLLGADDEGSLRRPRPGRPVLPRAGRCLPCGRRADRQVRASDHDP